MMWVLCLGILLLVWSAATERPGYRKSYLQTRSEGSFSTSYDSRLYNYLEYVKEEVKSRSTLGPISPIDDLYTPLYHPEFRQNWQPSLSRNLLTYWISLVRNVGLSLVVLLLF